MGSVTRVLGWELGDLTPHLVASPLGAWVSSWAHRLDWTVFLLWCPVMLSARSELAFWKARQPLVGLDSGPLFLRAALF